MEMGVAGWTGKILAICVCLCFCAFCVKSVKMNKLYISVGESN